MCFARGGTNLRAQERLSELSCRGSAGKVMSRIAGTALLCAMPLLAGCSRTTHAGATVATTARSAALPTASRVPGPAIPSTLVTPVVKELYSGGGLTVTLTTVAVAGDDEVTANVSYNNVGSSALTLTCSGAADPATDTLTSANGAVVPASRTYCSDHAAATIDLPPGGALPSYAVFYGVQARSGPFTLTWQESGAISGAVSGIILRRAGQATLTPGPSA
jgi:hypothetical protein